MINVIFGVNKKSISLKDRINLAPAYLVMKLNFKGQSDLVKIIQVEDISSDKSKVNEIIIELVELVDEDLDLGKVNLISGDYNYTVYLNSELGLSTSGKLLESGILRYDKEIFTEKSLNNLDIEKTLL